MKKKIILFFVILMVIAIVVTIFTTLTPENPAHGDDNPNLLEGTTSYVTCGYTPALGEDFVFNLSLSKARLGWNHS